MTAPTHHSTALGALLLAVLATAVLPTGAVGVPRAFPSAIQGHGERFPGEPIEVRFVGRNGSRVKVLTVVAVPVDSARINDHGFFNLRLTGEVLVDGRRYDHFGYHFDIPDDQSSSEVLALSFERYLRPGDFRLVVQVEDLQSGTVLEAERALTVPRPDQIAPPPVRLGGGGPAPAGDFEGQTSRQTARGLDVGLSRDAAIRLLPPPQVVRGHQTFVAVTRGEEIERVQFSLDGVPVLSRNRPPFEATLDLGESPGVKTLRVDGIGADGQVLARDEVQLNTSGDRLAIQLLDPAPGDRQGDLLTVRARVEAPASRRVERVEIYLDQERVAVWRQPPWQGQIRAPATQVMPLRAVVVLDEGAQAEDALLLNSSGHDSIRVDLVELSTAAVDRRGRPVEGLGAPEFRILEDGVEQRLERFETVRDAPVHLALVVDTSGSMDPIMGDVIAAGAAFFQQILGERDRAIVVTFATSARVRVPFTSSLPHLANGLDLLEARGSTALYDSLLFTLSELDGIRGQRAIVLLSDGVDNSSHHSASDVMELARRSAVTIYTVGIEEAPGAGQLDRETLRLLAEESGGRSYFVRGDRESLGEVYSAIEADVRSRYMLSYYSSNTASDGSFRLVDVEISRPRVQARTIRGYYP